uniref:Outer membrane beta-barrel protein n=1 Tax=Roseihalotalea indica TaxID=2867963 RepID=A0AA49GQ08_9BACT|nr:outer membrane beta-barrel protein [Tunicatimonas sp. TK19036]
MKKLLFTICTLIVIHTASHAQLSVGVSGAPVFPMGNFANISDMGYGFGIEGKYQVSPNVLAGVSFQRFSFSASPFGLNIPGFDFSLTPIAASLAFTPMTDGIKPYVGIKGGAYNMKINSFIDISRTYFGFAPTAGILIPINKNIDLHANAEYHTIFMNESLPFTEVQFKENITLVPINIGLSFKIGQ